MALSRPRECRHGAIRNQDPDGTVAATRVPSWCHQESRPRWHCRGHESAAMVPSGIRTRMALSRPRECRHGAIRNQDPDGTVAATRVPPWCHQESGPGWHCRGHESAAMVPSGIRTRMALSRPRECRHGAIRNQDPDGTVAATRVPPWCHQESGPGWHCRSHESAAMVPSGIRTRMALSRPRECRHGAIRNQDPDGTVAATRVPPWCHQESGPGCIPNLSSYK